MRPTRAASCWTGQSLKCVWTLLGLPLLCAARYLMALSYLPAWPDRYNVRRLHGSLGNVPPVEYEQAHYAALNREPQPVWDRRRTWGASFLRPRASRPRSAGASGEPLVIDDQALGVNGEDEPTLSGVAVTPCG